MTQFDRIKQMTIDEMAEYQVRTHMELDEDGFDYDITYSTSDGKFFSDKKIAIEHEKEYLNSEVYKDNV